jgi:hypothetical protein
LFVGFGGLKVKYWEEYVARHKKGDAGVPDGIMNRAVYIRSQTL